MDARPIKFIQEAVNVTFSQAPALEKSPGCPDGFAWRGQNYQITQLLAEWRDYNRRGFMARNMSDEHASSAARRGSWGVGKFYFRVKTAEGRIFDLYYDRAPKDVDHRKGDWFLYQELEA